MLLADPHCAALPAELWQLMQQPPIHSADLPGIGGSIRASAQDFIVDEIPAYAADGIAGGEHLFVRVRKVDLTTEQVVRELARHCEIRAQDIGVAGLKDKCAITTQWLSVPSRIKDHLASFSHPQITLGVAIEHQAKLRRGHLHANNFAVTVRGLEASPAANMARCQRKLTWLSEHGLVNSYGEQRFGRDGHNLAQGLQALAQGTRHRQHDFARNAVQAGLFNLYLAHRHRQGLMHTVLVGDVLKKRATGGLFYSTDAATDQGRLLAGEIDLTGPIFGSKMLEGPTGTPGYALESEVLAQVGLARQHFARLGQSLPGTRRQLVLRNLTPAAIDTVSDDPTALQLRFTLPTGSYATTFLREIMQPSASLASGTAVPNP